MVWKIKYDNQRNQQETEPLHITKKRRLPMGKKAQDARNFTAPVEEHELEERYEKYKRILAGLTVMSDIFMRNVLKKRECTEYILQVIMDREDLEVKEQILQKDYKNLQGRSAILDSVVCDREGKRYNVEIQQENEGASVKRARYHSSLLDVNTLKEGQNFEELGESYVIFITRNDVLGYGLPIYHIGRRIKEVSEEFPDKTYIIYVNAKIQDETTELGRLMHDLQCRNAEEMYSEILAERVRELKETPKGVDSMCREMDEIYNEGMEKGIEKGLRQGLQEGKMEMKQETVLSMANLGMPVEQIAAVVKESVGIVQKWISEGKAAV